MLRKSGSDGCPKMYSPRCRCHSARAAGLLTKEFIDQSPPDAGKTKHMRSAATLRFIRVLANLRHLPRIHAAA